MTSAKSVKHVEPIEIDPNFFLPPNVVDMRYVDLDKEADSPTSRDDSGAVVSIDYDEISFSDLVEGEGTDSGNGSPSKIAPPDWVTIISQEVRVTSDGKFVVDVILEVEDVPGAIQYDVRLTKP